MLGYLEAKDWRRIRAGYRPEMARIPRGAAADRSLGRKKKQIIPFLQLEHATKHVFLL